MSFAAIVQKANNTKHASFVSSRPIGRDRELPRSRPSWAKQFEAAVDGAEDAGPTGGSLRNRDVVLTPIHDLESMNLSSNDSEL